MTDELRARLDAVERAVTAGETDRTPVADTASVEDRLTTVETRLDTLEERVSDLDATTQAVRGYLSGVGGVTEDVERQATLALAKVEAVEAHVFEADEGLAVERLPTANGVTQTTEETHDTEHHSHGSPTLVTRLRDAL